MPEQDRPWPVEGDSHRWIPGKFEQRLDGDVLTFRGQCSREYVAGRNVAHGGWTAALMDELLGACANANRAPAVTGTLTVTYLRPVPVDHDLVCHGQVDRVEGRRRFVSGEIRLSSTDVLLARGEGVFIEVRDDHYDRNDEWVRQQDAQ